MKAASSIVKVGLMNLCPKYFFAYGQKANSRGEK